MKEMNDDTVMDFGRYYGRKVRDVPVSYWHYMWSRGQLDRSRHGLYSPEFRYIYKNMRVMKMAMPDGNWEY